MRLYALGSNGSGQLGIGSSNDVSAPQLCRFTVAGQHIQPSGLPLRFAAGGNAIYILFNDGDLYRAGRRPSSSTDQQLFESSTFERLDSTIFSRMKLCSSFWDGAVFVNVDNEVFVEGSGPAGELGLGRERGLCQEPAKLQDFPPSGLDIIDIASCASHTVAVLSNGEAWGWGNGRKGQLGEPADVIWEPRKITNVEFPIVRVACGREFTFLVGEASTGRLAVLGPDKWGIRTGAPSETRGWKDINASWGSIFVLDQSDVITSWGRNDRGQLAPPNLPVAKRLAVGSEHVLALSTEGNVLAWGWGEHGNCGLDTDQQGNVRNGKWNVIPLDHLRSAEVVLGVSAGCATSFLWTS